MSEPERFEALILGSGQGGSLLAWHMANTGRRTAVVERRWVGGSCPNIACLPSKNEIWSARVAHLVRNAAQFGLDTGPIKLDMAKVRQRKSNMVDGSVAAHLENYRTSGAELIMGTGHFVAPKTLEVRLNDGGHACSWAISCFGIPARVAKLPMSAVLRTLTTGEGAGFMKALVAESDDRILGFTMIGADADGLLAAMQMAILAKLPYPAVRDAIFAHPPWRRASARSSRS